MDKNKLYRKIPKVDLLLEEEEIQELIGRYSRDTVLEAIHTEMDGLRRWIGQCEDEEKALERIEGLNGRIARTVEAMHTPNMRPGAHLQGAYGAGRQTGQRLFQPGVQPGRRKTGRAVFSF